MNIDPLSKSYRLARRGRYKEVIGLLEPLGDRYYNSFLYHYLLGLAYLRNRELGNAMTAFKDAKRIKLRDTSVLLGMAALYLYRGDTDEAVDLYLEVQALDDKNRLAQRALKVIRRHPGPENIALWVDSGGLPSLFPPLPKLPRAPVRLPGALVTTFLAAAVLGGGVFALARSGLGARLLAGLPELPAFLSFLRPAASREVSASLDLEQADKDAPMQVDGVFRYVLTRDEVLRDYNEARRLFVSYRDERARVYLNRVLESNGPEAVKNKARLLLSYMEVPGFDTLKDQDRFTYAEVLDDPVLYRDCHVIWRGMATNVEVEETHTAFEFLVGYDTRRTMEGIVRVDFDFAVAVNPERPLEVLGRVVPISTEKGAGVRLQGVALNQAGLLP